MIVKTAAMNGIKFNSNLALNFTVGILHYHAVCHGAYSPILPLAKAIKILT